MNLRYVGVQAVNQGVKYYCYRVDKHGFREYQWLDMPCKGWKIVKRSNQ